MKTSSAVYDANKLTKQRLLVNIPKVHTHFQLVVQPSTRIHSIVIDVCKKLGIDHLQSNVKIFRPLASSQMDPTTTVHQNKIKDNETVYVQIDSANANWSYHTKSHDFETVGEYRKYMPKKYITPGFNVEAMCVHPECVNYGKEKVIPLGTGHFNYGSLVTNLKCQLCPDRDKNTNPPLAVKAIVLVSCFWRFTGEAMRNGFPIKEFNKGWRRVEECDKTAFSKLWADYQWRDLTIVCRGL